MLNNVSKLALGGLLAAGLASNVGVKSAKASSETQTFTFSQSAASLVNISYQLFNSSLGTLTDVKFLLNGTAVGTDVYTTGADLAPPFTYNIGQTNANSARLLITGPPSGHTYVNHVETADFSDTGTLGNSATYTSTSDPSAILSTDTATSGLGVFIGTGTSPTDLVLGAPGGITSATNNSVGISTTPGLTVSGSFDLVYDYSLPVTGVPEPGTWALLAASGSLTLVGLRRRRSLKK